MPNFLAGNEGSNAVIIARYCKLWGLSPADEFGIIERPMRMAVHVACFLAYCEDENKLNDEMKEQKAFEALTGNKVLEQYKESLTGRG